MRNHFIITVYTITHTCTVYTARVHHHCLYPHFEQEEIAHVRVLVVYQYQCNTHTQSCFVWVVKPGSSERSNFQESALHKAATKLHIENFTWIA